MIGSNVTCRGTIGGLATGLGPPVREMADEIRTLSTAAHRRILESNRNRPHREATHDWRDRQ